MTPLELAASYVGKCLQTYNDEWFVTLLSGAGLSFQAGESGWGIKAVTALFGKEKLTPSPLPVVGGAYLMQDDEANWAGIITEIDGDYIRSIEFGTRLGYSQQQSGWEVQYKRREIIEVHKFLTPINSVIAETEKRVDEIVEPAEPPVESFDQVAAFETTISED